jgi:hypothetical protein
VASLLKILLIEWVDSSYHGGWIDKDELEMVPIKCFSAGVVINENHDAITLALSGGKGEQYANTMTIPKCSITRIRELKVKDARPD